MKRLLLGLLAALLCVGVASAKSKTPKAPKHDWSQGEVCRGAVCLNDIAFVNEGGDGEWFTGVIENKSTEPLHYCTFKIPLGSLDGTVIVGEASAYGPSEIPAGASYIFKAPIGNAWDAAKQVNVDCREGAGTILFRYPIIWNYWNQRQWRKENMMGPNPAPDPNQHN